MSIDNTIRTTSDEASNTPPSIEEQEVSLSTPEGISFFSRDTVEVRRMLDHFRDTTKTIAGMCEKFELECTYIGTGKISISGPRSKIVDLLLELRPQKLIIG